MKKIKLTKEEINFLEENLKDIFENSFFKGDWDEFQEFSTTSKKEFDRQLNILKNIRVKLNK